MSWAHAALRGRARTSRTRGPSTAHCAHIHRVMHSMSSCAACCSVRLLELRAPGADGQPNVGAQPAAAPRRQVVLEAVATAVDAHEQRMAGRSGDRTPVVPVNDDDGVAPIALGLLVAYAQELDGGRLRDRYDFVPEFLTDEETLLARASEAVDLPVLELRVDARTEPRALGARETRRTRERHDPRRPEHAEVRAATPRTSSPRTRTSTSRCAARARRRSPSCSTRSTSSCRCPISTSLRDVPGLTFRALAAESSAPDDRDRIADLDTIPSPYLIGLFDAFGAAQSGAIIETNRGCPYGCTFCDWGSATLSRIRKFSLDRVFAELEWCAQQRDRHRVASPTPTSASSSATSRSPRRSPSSSATYGYPQHGRRPTTPRTRSSTCGKIIEIFADAGIVTEGMVSLQSMDEPTLKIIRRTNIKVEKYDDLADRVPPRPAAALGRPHDGTAGLDAGFVPQRPAGVHRPRRARACQPDAAAAEQPDERSGVPARARHHRQAGRDRHRDRVVHARRVGRDGPAPPGVTTSSTTGACCGTSRGSSGRRSACARSTSTTA